MPTPSVDTLDYNALLVEIADAVTQLPSRGEVAQYIPELAGVDPGQFGMAVYCVDGRTYGVGDCDTRFSIQSLSKVLSLALVCTRAEAEVWSRVGVEPSGDPFNSLVQLEYEEGIPRNPLINAGALVISDLLLESFSDPQVAMLEFASALSGSALEIDARVASSEMEHSSRNRALTHFMKSFGNIRNEVQPVLDLYVAKCSIAMTCHELARAYSFLAASGYSTQAERQILDPSLVRRINALMLTCGFYDEAGDFAFRVGLPGKSGVGGGIVAVCPGRFTVAAWSPRLGAKGNSVLATEALCRFTTACNASVF